MAERTVELLNTTEAKGSEALEQATERAERAEAELARLKAGGAGTTDQELKSPPSPSTAASHGQPASDAPKQADGEAELRKDSMMAHLLDSLAAGKDIGHYGRLVFAMVARHFLSHQEVLDKLTADRDFSAEQARLMLTQVEDRDYSPPRRDRILEWQAKQEFPILPSPDDPDCGNLYRNLTFPEQIYEHIGHYQEARQEAGE